MWTASAMASVFRRCKGAALLLPALLALLLTLTQGAVCAGADAAVQNDRYTSEAAYVNMIRPIARRVGLKYGYLPSVLAAQCILETGYGGFVSASTQPMIRNHNHLGMKTEMLNSTWAEHTVWPGRSFLKRTPEYYNGTLVTITDSFRIYDSVEQCLVDYVQFMTWVKRGSEYKYRKDVIGNPSYKRTIAAVRENGYCTDPIYDQSVIRLIEKWNLTKLDNGFGIPVNSVKLFQRAIQLGRGGSYKLKAGVIPANAANPALRWRSSNTGIVTVSAKGVVTAHKRGTAYVYVISRANSSIRARCRVTVK